VDYNSSPHRAKTSRLVWLCKYCSYLVVAEKFLDIFCLELVITITISSWGLTTSQAFFEGDVNTIGKRFSTVNS
jgi:hypothetical protein